MKKVKFIFLLLVLCLGGGVYYYMTGNYSDGFRAGTIVKLSHKGFIFKTYEGQLNLGMVINSDPNASTSVNNVWEFSVLSESKNVIDSLEMAMTAGQRVRLHYREKFRAMPWMGETRYFIYKVDFSNKD